MPILTLLLRRGRFVALAGVLAGLSLLALSSSPAGAAASPRLTRYPYLTDVVSAGSTDNATVNFATTRRVRRAVATIGPAGTSCTTTEATGSRTAIRVGIVPEYQWKASFTGLSPGKSYCYRLFADSRSGRSALLGGEVSQEFATPPAPGSDRPFKFAVFGDFGWNPLGFNPGQANLDQQIAKSGAKFALGTGDTAYLAGSQLNYGDLFQRGPMVSTVFAPYYYKNIGDKIPMYDSVGNHGINDAFLNIWPQPTATSLSGGSDHLVSYCCVNGTKPTTFPAVWYAFSVGNTRFYVLTASWSTLNNGTGNQYSNDYAIHWTRNDPEYQWLAHDLAAHPGGLKFVVMHYPMYSDTPGQESDTYLHSGGTDLAVKPGSVAALLSQNDVQIVFNGHAHTYERNTRQKGESFLSYVTGGGGASLATVGPCSSFDAYAIGWNNSKLKGTACGAATPPRTRRQVYNFLLVTVNGSTVTVTPTDSTGHTFDVQKYSF